MPDTRYLPTSCGQRGHCVLQNSVGQFFPLFLLAQHSSKLESIAKDTTHFGCETWRKQDQTNKDTSCWLVSVHAAKRCCTDWLQKKDIDRQGWGGHRPLGRAYCCYFVKWLCCQNTFKAFMSISINVDNLDQRGFFLPWVTINGYSQLLKMLRRVASLVLN